MNRRLLLSALLLATPLAAQEEAKPLVNQSGEITITGKGRWEISPGAESNVVRDGQAVFKLTVPQDNMHVEFKLFELEPKFDVMMPEFVGQIKESLSEGGMQVVSSREGLLLGEKAFIIHAIQLSPREGEDQVVHVVSISAFFGKKFLTLSIADDSPDVLANENAVHLLEHLKVKAD